MTALHALDVVAFGAHPDDVELGCGGTLARLVESGRRVAIVSLTRGEAGSRGTPLLRAEEAREAGRRLGATEVVLLDCGDGSLRSGPKEEDQVIEVLRRMRPEVVLAPPPTDRHPDHGRAFALVRDACFYSGLVRRGEGEPHRPGLLLSYQLHDSFQPTLVVDVTSTWQSKMAALEAHRSQLATPHARQGSLESRIPGAQTKVASQHFWHCIEARARLWGLMIGCELGEPFLAHGPLAISDPFSLLQEALR